MIAFVKDMIVFRLGVAVGIGICDYKITISQKMTAYAATLIIS